MGASKKPATLLATIVLFVARASIAEGAQPEKGDLRFGLGAGTTIAFGTAPHATPGARVEVELANGPASAGLEGRVDAPASKTVGGDEVSVFLVLGGASGCLRNGMIGACLLFEAGALRASGERLIGGGDSTSPYLAAGARGLVTIPIGGPVDLRVILDVVATFTRIALVDGGSGAEYWTTPPLAVLLGIGVFFGP